MEIDRYKRMKKVTYVSWSILLVIFLFFVIAINNTGGPPTGNYARYVPDTQQKEVAKPEEPIEEIEIFLEERNLDINSLPDTKIYKKYEWEYRDKDYNFDLKFPTVAIDFYKWRERDRPLNEYVNDEYEYVVGDAVNEIEKQGKRAGLPKNQIPYLVISFVQNLPYNSDNISTGHNEYPRFPFETLVEDGGDCEDSSILAAAMLKEMGYGVVLFDFPGHVAVGFRCDGSFTGDLFGSYEYNGHEYCYLETTSEFPPGMIPAKYKDINPEIISIP